MIPSTGFTSLLALFLVIGTSWCSMSGATEQMVHTWEVKGDTQSSKSLNFGRHVVTTKVALADEGRGTWSIWVNNPLPYAATIVLYVNGQRPPVQATVSLQPNHMPERYMAPVKIATVNEPPQTVTAYWIISHETAENIRKMERLPSLH
ncbi:hypothetical protein PGT21_028970 [Puccinia graminis f. sp. tritici]|uniref:Uncharacterized protein n=2 Tax=Puccinia graminis f. sp. tritici TaxID=56615 RepID=E3K6N5_PUCGT|nr:uncharacterized protein PGTG_05256 [Puccinia graminis f. sp. tritici CRL 75-36-700-3]KAA1075816.1 hypothetical protein PGTUg99_017218 [Puccinia graminis f. sp. tritici]EFP80031.2 hypothetical protein PGTG_05256 [Puccinia graminis f. sp. tritici CRL 75-36-700-3]KAA1091167.1 hypothetical protein PGT21_027550 [Puccinia graminis f. sp. tritici]KAA1110661.1 hypothetical protein PGT21_028970 [Puccinia graminis f. sp. tritici]KAA1139281.1 hypothetical protein PGTUg99_037636 [Puccinia graminis f. s